MSERGSGTVGWKDEMKMSGQDEAERDEEPPAEQSQ